MNRRGFFLMEAIVGIVLMLAIAASLFATLRLRQQLNDKAGARQRATDDAEAALVSMQNGRPRHNPAVTLADLSDQAPANFRWVRASCSVDGESVAIIGLVPAEVKP